MVNSMIGVSLSGCWSCQRPPIINMLQPADASVLLITSEAESAAAAREPDSLCRLRVVHYLGARRRHGVADKIGEKRIDPQAAA